jgi:hypothetical protein
LLRIELQKLTFCRNAICGSNLKQDRESPN